MKNKYLKLFFILTLFPCSFLAAQLENDLPKSGEQRYSFDAEAGIGFDKKNSQITGFYHFKQIQMADHSFHADCKIIFSGEFKRDPKVTVIATVATGKKQKIVNGILEFRGYTPVIQGRPAEQIFSLKLSENIPSCTDAIDVPDSNFDFSIDKLGGWKTINAIRAKRAYFHDQPNEASKGKAFIVTGDLIYIYDENQDWYYVKYQSGKNKETAGWIRKTDTIQFPERR